MGRYLEWTLLLVCVVALQNVLSSPIPTQNEEWEEFERMLRSPDYKLPTTTIPVHYDLTLTPYFDTVPQGKSPFTFDGTVDIQITAQEQVNEIIMHCNDLIIHSLTVEYTDSDDVAHVVTQDQNYECEMPYSFLRIPTNETLQTNTMYTAKISFSGNLQTNMRGFYRSWYRDNSTGIRWMGTTQFQPGHARQAFPCYDEPGFKATFDITIVRDEDFSPTISNMPIRVTSEPVDGKITETFYTTPKTSTYLLAFIVSHYIKVSEGTNPERPFDIYARNNAGSTGDWSLEIGEKLLDAMEKYTNISYYGMAPNMNMKQAAIPDFSAGAMENWGLLTYREALILFDPLNSNNFYRQRVANIVSHEVAHMWFGNLVTCAWWDNLWLNEGFARFYQYYLTGSVAPELGYGTRFIVEQFQDAMTSDSVDTAHALTSAVYTPAAVTAHFSTITYARGACILRMTQHLLSEDTFVKGLRMYLATRSYDVAEPQHLFEALDYAAAEDGALSDYGNITIDSYFRTWSEKAGHPLLTVNIDQATGIMTVTQARWERDTGTSQFDSLWDIPITWTRRDDADFNNLKPSQFISEASTIINRGSVGNEWVVFNKQASGFYRVNYDRTNWALITQALREDIHVLHEYNRAQIIGDVFAFGRAGVMSYDRVMNILSYLEFEDQYAPWIAAINGFNFLLRRVAHDETSLQDLRKTLRDLSVSVTRRLGYNETSENYMDNLLRMYLMEFLCSIEHEECVAAAEEHFNLWRNGEYLLPNLRPWAYCVGLRKGGQEDFDFFWNSYLEEDLASEQVVMLQVAGCTSDEASLQRFLDAIVEEEEIVRPQDLTTALNSAITRNEYNTFRVFEWLKNNTEKVSTKFGSVQTVLNSIASRLLNTDDIAAFESWVNENTELIGSASQTAAIAAAEAARINLQWSEQRLPELERYFETGYVEDDIPQVTPEVTTEGTTEGATEGTTEDTPEVTTEGATEGTTEDTPEATTENTQGTSQGTTEAATEGTTEGTTTPDNAGTISLSLFAVLVSLAISFSASDV